MRFDWAGCCENLSAVDATSFLTVFRTSRSERKPVRQNMDAIVSLATVTGKMTASATATTKAMITSAVSPSTKRTSSKIAKLQGYVVRGVTSAAGKTGNDNASSAAFNTKRSLLRLVRPTVAGRPATSGQRTSSSSSSTHHHIQQTYYSSINSSGGGGGGTTLTDWTTVYKDGRRSSTVGNYLGTVTELLGNSTYWRESTTYLNTTTTDWPLCGSRNGSSTADGSTCYDDLNGTYRNGTYGYDDDSEAKNFWALLLFLFPLLTVFGNVLVILSVFRERTLQTATNYFIISLAIADLLVATLVVPFAVYVTVNVKWDLPDVVCDFYIAMDVTCSTSSILNLVAISIDRYIAVTQPIKYARHKNHKRVWLTIGLVWAISIAIGLPIVLGLNNTERRVSTDCAFYNADFVIYSSLSSFYIPCIIMVVLYYQIFKGIRERAKRATASRKPQHAHLMDNLAPHTKRLAETAMGGTPITGQPPTQQQQQQQPQQQPQQPNRTQPHPIAGSMSGTNAVVGVTSGTVSLLSTAAPATLASKTSLLGRAASMNKSNRRRSLFDDDKGTDQGSASQDEEDDDDKDGEDGSCWGEGSPETRDKANEFILMAKQQKDIAIAGNKVVASTTVTAAAAAVMSNGDTNGCQTPADGSTHILGHPLAMADGVPCLTTNRSGSQKTKGGKGKGNRGGGGGGSSCGGVDSTADTPPSGSGYGGAGVSIGPGGADKESKQYQSASSRFTIYKVNKASRKKREKSSAKKERKATKTLAIVLGVFLICWVPFFTCNILDAICTKFERDCQPGVVAFHLTTWLGYVNSFINPVIYTIFNLEFRKAFKRILVCAD